MDLAQASSISDVRKSSFMECPHRHRRYRRGASLEGGHVREMKVEVLCRPAYRTYFRSFVMLGAREVRTLFSTTEGVTQDAEVAASISRNSHRSRGRTDRKVF